MREGVTVDCTDGEIMETFGVVVHSDGTVATEKEALCERRDRQT